MNLRDEIAGAFVAACRDEIESPKPGNVHVFAPGHRMTAEQFLASAAAAAGPLTAPGARLGERILGAVEATAAAVGTNTNLGIVLLSAPLAAAAEARPRDLRTGVAGVLDGLDVVDASLAFRAIVLAAPGGLGRTDRHDVTEPATVGLRQAMAEAAGRDRIARQYVSTFADVFELGLSALAQARTCGLPPSWATLAVYLAFLTEFVDSHVMRKHGLAAAERLRQEAVPFRARIEAGERTDDLFAALLAWDDQLKVMSINPGTSADLTVATLFSDRLRTILPSRRIGD